MANTTETVFIDFVVQDEQVESALTTLQKTDKIDKTAADQFKKTNAELAKRQQVIDGLNKQLRDTQAQNAKSIADLEARFETFIKDFVEGFSEGIVDTLQQAGFEFDEFGKIVNKNNETTVKSSKSLKGELRAMTLQLAEMKRRGEDNTEEYRELAQAAGELKDTIGDASAEVNAFASDTSKIDGLIGTVQGVAGAFSIAQGVAGAFGAEGEELNEVMLKVNSSLAILQGLQAVGNALQKESAAMIFLNTTAQQVYNFVIGESIGLLKAFRIALAATGVGLAVIGIIALYQWLTKTSKATKELTKDYQTFNDTIARDTRNLNNAVAEGTRILEENQARGKARGEQQSDLAKQEIADLRSTFQAVFDLEQAQRDRALTAEQTLRQMATGERDYNEELAGVLQTTIETYKDTQQRRLDIANQIRVREVENEKQLRVEKLQAIADGINAQLALTTKNTKKELDLAKQAARAQAAVELEEAGQNLTKRLLIENELRRKIRELDAEYARVRQQDRVSAVEAELTATQQRSREINNRVSQEEIDLQKRQIAEEARLSLLQDGLTANQRLAIQRKAIADQAELQREFNQQSNAEAIQDLISRNNAQLSNIKLTNKERLVIQEENLIAAAQIEIDANFGLADKIKEIRGKLNEDLRALRLAALQKELADELSLEASRTGALRRASERTVSNENKGLQARLNAVNQIAALDIANVNARQDTLEESLNRGLISQEEYNVQYAALKDEETKIFEDAELKKRSIEIETIKGRILLALETANAVSGIIQQFGQIETEREQQRIDEQRARVDELREAGAITEKEALNRQKKLDQEEARLKRKQAERDKAVALFQAVINTAAAVTKALPNLVLAGIAAALGLAQVALIASKPIPKFGKGKKNSYEGPAEIGETGAELWQHDGDMYLAKKSSIVWMGKHDKVFNPKETAAMLDKGDFKPYIVKDADTNEYKTIYNSQFDYDKLGKVIIDNMPQVGLNVDANGLTHWVSTKNSFTKYIDNRRSY